jgi:hypothetical protein
MTSHVVWIHNRIFFGCLYLLTTLYTITHSSLLSLLCLHWLLLGYGSQQWRLLFRAQTPAGWKLSAGIKCRLLTANNSHLQLAKKSKSNLLYDWRVTASQFVLAPNPLGLIDQIFFQLNSRGHSPCVTSSLTRRWVWLL